MSNGLFQVWNLKFCLFIYGFVSHPRTFGDVTIAEEGLQNLGLYSALRAFEQGGIFITPAVTRDLGFLVLIRRNTPFSHLIFTFCYIPYYILLQYWSSSFPCHETMNTDDMPLIVVTSHNMTSQYKSTPRRTVHCFVTSCWQRQRSSVNSYTPIGLSHKITIKWKNTLSKWLS
jgi:hypothetical protein